VSKDVTAMPSEPGVTIVNRSRDVVIADQVEIASSFWARGKGLIGRKSLPHGFALVIQPCGSIHMCLMSLPIDVLHIDRQGRVVKILHAIKPWRLGPIVFKSAWVVELPAYRAAETGAQVGDLIDIARVAASSADAVEERAIGDRVSIGS
jgi:uncharacterized membrane protein (UPF0127 family)